MRPRIASQDPDLCPPTSALRPLISALWLLTAAFCLLAPALLQAQTNSNALATNTSTNLAAGSTNAVPAAALAANMDTLDDVHKLASGDRLSMRIVEDQEEPKSLTVMDSGDIEVLQIGRFPAKDKTCRQLARELKVELQKDYYYQATVIIAVDQLSRSRGRVFVMGAVQAKGPQEIPSNEVFTIGKAIMSAGGFADYADKKRVMVTRKPLPGKKDNQILIINVGEIIEKGKTANNIQLEPEDIIFVPTRSLSF
jgi:protein involved in polysaccharide export with SLBB domain